MRRNVLFLAIACTGLLAACTQPGYGGGGTPANQAPTAVIGASTTSGVAHLSVDFTAAGSTDADGTVASYEWDFGDGTTSTAATGQALYTEAGAYLVELTVTDDDGLASTTVQQIITVTDNPEGRYVATGGVDAPGCQSSLAPCATVNYAVGQADATGDTVYVDSGTYPEMVYVAKNVAFKGANQGNSAGAAPDARRAESTLKGIRTGTSTVRPGSVPRSIQIDGFTFDPQGDATLVPGNNTSLVWLLGAANTVIENSAFVGGPYTATCGSSCTTNVDRAIEVRTGDVTMRNNSFANFKRATSFYQTGPTGILITSASFTGNKVTGYTSQGLQIAPAGGNPSMPGVTVEDNIFDATGFELPASAPASIVATTGTNTYDGNQFIGSSAALYLYTCVSNYVTGPQTITNNTFEGNRSAVAVAVDTPLQCAVHNFNGSVIENNNFNSGHVTQKNGVTASATYFANGAAPLDASCNWWGVATGPNSGGVDNPVDANITVSPWLVAPAPGGGCTGV